jgi:predicted metal-binding protein
MGSSQIRPSLSLRLRIQRCMSKGIVHPPSVTEAQSQTLVRTYPAPWKGQLVMVCRKCQNKLKHEGKKNGLAKLKKTLKKRARRDEDGLRLYIVDVSCLNLCPKGGVTVCTQQQLENEECSIVRTSADVNALLMQCREASARGEEGSNAAL